MFVEEYDEDVKREFGCIGWCYGHIVNIWSELYNKRGPVSMQGYKNRLSKQLFAFRLISALWASLAFSSYRELCRLQVLSDGKSVVGLTANR